MGCFDFRNFCILLLAGALSTEVSAKYVAPAPQDRVLRAATKRSDLFRRSMRIEQKFETELSYIETENGWGSSSIFASSVRVNSKAPIFNLKEHEHYLQDIRYLVSTRDARHACHGESRGFIITSHETCNVDGERAVYKRQDSASTTPLTLNSIATQSVVVVTPVSFTVSALTSRPAVPTGIPDDKESTTFDLAFQALNKTFKPNDFLNGVKTILNVPTMPLKSCSYLRKLQNNLYGLAMQAFKSRFVKLQANRLTAYIKLSSKPSASGQFKLTLFKLPIMGFVIPGMGQAGVTFEATIQTSYNVTGGIEATYGFDLWIPTSSKVTIPFPDLSNASKVGFDAAQVSALPFNANTSDIDLTLSVRFQPIITVSFVLSNAQLDAKVNIFIDLPSLTAKFLSKKDSFNAECNLLSPSNSTSNSTSPNSPH
ncbi:hypothetical protein BCR34DRAFT_669805 [Clohesyomyces aquaticus]|uniref:Uncharacterized protein n=1 Tax=Clohesyomyces aquaticus TaxID=1231657 RepID=A0A1Y1Y6X2_9PLEO|nr:hypothetical protein BCR34DRAFT_669805 [Clohesyomyces aquaticus]